MTIPPRHRINVVLTLPQYNALREQATREGETMATLIRRAIEAEIKRGKKP